MDLFDRITNIGNIDIEVELQKSIYEVRNDLNKLSEERTCKIYSSVLFENLKNKHILSHMVSTSDLGFNYEHYFLLIPNANKYYLSDLTFSQFSAYNPEYSDLLIAGYQEVDKEFLNKYLEFVTNEKLGVEYDIENVFFSENKHK